MVDFARIDEQGRLRLCFVGLQTNELVIAEPPQRITRISHLKICRDLQRRRMGNNGDMGCVLHS